MPLFTRPQSTFLGTASQVESYVFALARFEAEAGAVPKSSGTRKSNGPTRPPRTAREMIERCQAALPLPDLMQWLLAQEPDGATDELLYWFSRLSRDARFQRERLQRREYETTEHCVSLCSFALNPAARTRARPGTQTPFPRAKPMHLDLSELTQLAPIFRELFKGYHISHRDPELYTQLSSHQDQYRGLFRAMGFELVCDTRGFYYFVPEQVGAQVNKTAQRLALFTFILVEHLADQGRDPLSVLDGGSIGREELPPLLEKYRDLFLQAEVQTQEELEEKVMRRLTQLGFASEDSGVYRFMPPMHCFLDVCLSVQQDRNLSASLHADLPLQTPVLVDDGEIEPLMASDEELSEESEEDALARAIAEEHAQQEADARARPATASAASPCSIPPADSLGIFPLENPLSIYGANNLGKSASINALQFPILARLSDMSFGKYSMEQSRRFYFASDTSYILLELMLPHGPHVIGVAGRGRAAASATSSSPTPAS